MGLDRFMESLTRLGRYRLLRTLGQGGMAQVYLARMFGASGFETEVAVKVLLPAFRGAGPYERALIEEAKLGARLRHRNLVAVHDLGVDQGVYYVCMEYVDGADLATLATQAGQTGQALPVGLALLIAEEMAHALEYVHRLSDDRGRPLGLVHRDVSPSNILISRAGEVKLADFGVAKATMLADATLSNLRKGKYAYMSPEQVAGEALSAVSDQFGLGVTLAELLCGARPFDGATVMDTLDNIKAAAPPALDGLDTGPNADVAAIIRQCLAREPADRFASAAELGRALAEARRQRAVITPTDLGAWVAARMANMPGARI
jgi:serine/threonine-protein kinase